MNRNAIVVITLIVWWAGVLQSPAAERVPVGSIVGTVVFQNKYPVRLKGAKVIFKADTGDVQETVTHENGVFSITLRAEVTYTVSVESRGIWGVHRPPFRLLPDARVQFNFVVGVLHSSDSPPEALPKEDQRVFGDKVLIVASGPTEEQDEQIRYKSFQMVEKPIPVTISFDTYTVRAQMAVLDRRTNVLRAEGNVSIEDGSSASAMKSPCVTLRSIRSAFKIENCE